MPKRRRQRRPCLPPVFVVVEYALGGTVLAILMVVLIVSSKLAPNQEQEQYPVATVVEPAPAPNPSTEQTVPIPARVFVVHWTHVPKAGGTAFVQLAKQIACEKNKDLFFGEVSNPCCEKRLLCLKDGRCDSTEFGGCPLVLGVGLHSFNDARLSEVGCRDCGEKVVELSLRRNVLKIALAQMPTENFIRRNGKKVNATLEVDSHRRWPIEQRVEFFAMLGLDLVRSQLNEQRSTFGDANTNNLLRRAEKAAAKRRFHKASIREGEEHSAEKCEGSRSMTVLRHPFERSASAFFYRGHSPNHDLFNLRPGLWLPPSVKRTGTTMREYLYLPEYRNTLTKLFGESHGCKEAKVRCSHDYTHKEVGTCRCAGFAGCHAYRNATLDSSHVENAIRVLKSHAFVGIQEAPTASALLAARIFNLTTADGLLQKTRQSKSLKMNCSPSLVLRSDPTTCRAAFEAYSLDVVVFEKMHRDFCEKLRTTGLLEDPRVRVDLESARLCGETDFSDPDHICGRLETDEAYSTLVELRGKCRRATGRKWWLEKYGFYYEREKAS